MIQYSIPGQSTVHCDTVEYITVHCNTVEYTRMQNSSLGYSTVYRDISRVHFDTLQYIWIPFSNLRYSTVHYNIECIQKEHFAAYYASAQYTSILGYFRVHYDTVQNISTRG